MHADIDDPPIRGAVEEPPHPPGFIRQWVNHVQTRLLHAGECLMDVIDENRHVRVDRCGGVVGHYAELMASVISEGDDPAVIHEDAKPQNARVLLHRSGQIGHRQVWDHSLNMHTRIFACNVRDVRRR